ncbi:putative 149 kDa protein [Dissostichus eleginoides]|uniref:149 kDa protein n=1 Tax=Dissostichus eleginoides TaxID=100907 RepID=A0AAD9F1L3_DISEL|nr:putative 149 kDa protein [Dissostichus eleginoides]
MQYQKLQQQMEEEIGALEEKVKRKTQAAGGDTAPASVTKVYVNVNTGAQYHGQDLLLVPSEEPILPEGVVIKEGLVSVPRKRSGYVPVLIANTNKHSVTLTQRTVVGHLQTVKTAYVASVEQITGGEGIKSPTNTTSAPELSQRAADLNPEAEPFAPALTMQDGAPDLEDATVAQEETETDNRGITADGDGENGTAEPGESLQESSEEDDPDPPPATWEEAGAESLHIGSMSPACNSTVMWRPWASLDVEKCYRLKTLKRKLQREILNEEEKDMYGSDLQEIKNWRPVSLLCTDYKLLSRALSSRLRKVMDQVVDRTQTYCVPGGSIEKAFDRVEHRYLWKVLERFGLSPGFIAMIKVITILNEWIQRLTDDEMEMLREYSNRKETPDEGDPFPEIGILADQDGLKPRLHADIQMQNGKGFYRLCTLALNKQKLSERRDTVWKQRINVPGGFQQRALLDD